MIILFVSRDIGSANVTSAVAVHMSENHTIYVITEGPATDVFKKAGIIPTLSFSETKSDALMNWQQIFQLLNPDFVITGLSSPIKLENEAGIAANKSGIPLAVIEDAPGSSVRTKATPDIIFTQDEVSLMMAMRHHPQARIFISGNIGVRQVEGSVAIQTKFAALRKKYEKIFVFVESGSPDNHAVEEQIKLLGQCARMTQGEFCIIPRLHPKWMDTIVEGKSLHKIWMAMLESEIGNRLTRFDEGATEEVVSHADGTISVLSTLLTTSVSCGKSAISLMTPASQDYMRQTLGFEKLPLVELGCATLVSEPCDLTTLSLPSSEVRAKLKPFDPKMVCDVLESN